MAAEQGHASAKFNLGGMYALGVLYANGLGVPEDDAEAVRWYRLAAEQGDADAQFYLGFMYENGRGVPQDDGEAVRWYRLAVDQGRASAAPAQHLLGLMYTTGDGVPQDDMQAHMWLNLAASRLTGEDREMAAEMRELVAGGMTPAQLAEAQRLVREWDAAHPVSREPLHPLPASGRIGVYTRVVVVGASREKAPVYVASHRGG